MSKTKKAKTRNKRVGTKTKVTSAAKVAKGVRAQASRRTSDGKFTKVIFSQIGGKECRRFAALTWRERDVLMPSTAAPEAECGHAREVSSDSTALRTHTSVPTLN
jgi:hypothetical protein